MSRLKYLLPAAALLLAGAVTSAPAQAAPVALPGTIEALASAEAGVAQVQRAPLAQLVHRAVG